MEPQSPDVPSPADAGFQEVVRKGALAFVFKTLGALLFFAFQVLLARARGPSGVGAFYLALTVMLVASVLGRAGLDNAVLRFSAAASAHGERKQVAGLYRTSMRTCVLWSSIVTVVLVLGARLLATLFHERVLVTPLRLMALAVIPTGVVILHAQMLKGLRSTGSGVFLESCAIPFLGVALYLGAWTIGIATETAAVLCYVVATFVAAFLAYWMLRRTAPWHPGERGRFDGDLLSRTTRPLLVVALVDPLAMWSGVFVLGIMRNSHDVGVFGSVWRMALLLTWVQVSANMIAGPKYAAFAARQDWSATTVVARKTARAVTAIMTPAFVVFVAAPHLVLRVFGRGFQHGATALVILAAGQFVNVVTGPVTSMLMMAGQERMVRTIAVSSLALSVAIQASLVPALGITGAAIGTTVGLIVANVAAAVVVYRRLGVVIWPLPLRRSERDMSAPARAG